MTTSLLLVDDHAIVRRGLAALLSRDPRFTVVAEAGSCDEALAALDLSPAPDAAVLDLSLRDRSGLDFIREARARGWTGRILVLSMHDEALYAPKVLDAGAQGYLMKDQAEDALLEALSTVVSGGTYLSPAQTARMAAPPPAEESGLPSLTPREREILYAIGARLSTREIAEKFGLSGRTVDVHRSNIRHKLGCSSFAELLARAFQFKQQEDGLPPP